MSNKLIGRKISTDWRTYFGSFGELGEGDNGSAFYLQTVIPFNDIDKIKLICDIPDSERWSVKDLFQRDVDWDRVTDSLVEYFMDKSKVKFFNPLTLTLLPRHDSEEGRLLYDMPHLAKTDFPITIDNESINFRGYCHENNFKVGEDPDSGIGCLSWHTHNSSLVAIDGQHRLAALQEIQSAKVRPEGVEDWKIPVVIFNLRQVNPAEESKTILNSLRKIFVYINKEAKIPSATRLILLDEESVTSLCAQEIVERSHQNDVLPIGQRDDGMVPLMFFDWKGDEKLPTFVYTVEELKNNLDWFTIKSTPDDAGKALKIDPRKPIKRLFTGKRSFDVEWKGKGPSEQEAEEIRASFNGTLLPLYTTFFENFTPYRQYIAELRKLEHMDGHFYKQAFHALRFGGYRPKNNPTDEALSLAIKNVTTQIIKHKNTFIKGPVSQDVFGRAVFYAMSELYEYYVTLRGDRSTSLGNYAEWFVDLLNSVYDKDIFDKQNSDLEYIFWDASSTSWYKFPNVSKASGAFVVLAVLGESFQQESKKLSKWKDKPERDLNRWLEQQYKRIIARALRDGGMSQKQATQDAKARAIKPAKEQMERIQTSLGY